MQHAAPSPTVSHFQTLPNRPDDQASVVSNIKFQTSSSLFQWCSTDTGTFPAVLQLTRCIGNDSRTQDELQNQVQQARTTQVETTKVLADLLQAPDIAATARKHIDSINEEFFMVSSTYLDMVGPLTAWYFCQFIITSFTQLTSAVVLVICGQLATAHPLFAWLCSCSEPPWTGNI